jgi:hypothetical protein
MATFTTTQTTVKFTDTDGEVTFTATRPAVTFTAAYQSVVGSGGSTEVFRANYYQSAPLVDFGASITAGVLTWSVFDGFEIPVRVMFDDSGLGADRGIWVAVEDPGNPGFTDGTFAFADTAEQPYASTDNSGAVGSFGTSFAGGAAAGTVVYENGSWSFINYSTYSPADGDDWADPDPQTFSAALDALAAAGGGGASLSDATPADLGTASAGVATDASRSDHVHDRPTAAEVSVDASGFNGNLTTADDTVQEVAQKLDDLTIPAAGIPATLVDGKGELIVGSAADTVDNLAIGTDGHVLTLDSAQTLGVKWAAATGGGIADPGGANDDFLQRKAGAWTNRTVAQVRTDLALGGPTGFYEDNVYHGLLGHMHTQIGGGGTGVVHGANLLVMWRIMPIETIDVDGLTFLVNTDGGSGALARVGIYAADTSTTAPTGAPIAESGDVNVNVTNGTIVTGTFTAGRLTGYTPYWAAFVTNSATLSVRYLAGAVNNQAAAMDSGVTTSSNHIGRRVAHTFGALPSNPSATFNTNVGSLPGVLWRTQRI